MSSVPSPERFNGVCGLYSKGSFASDNAQLERGLPISEVSHQPRAPYGDISGEKQGRWYKNFQNGARHVPLLHLPLNLYLFLYNSLDEGEWS